MYLLAKPLQILFGVARMVSLGGSAVKNPPANAEERVWSLDQKDLLEKEMATHSSILVWEIPWTEEPGGLQSMGSQRVGHNLLTKQMQIINMI